LEHVDFLSGQRGLIGGPGGAPPPAGGGGGVQGGPNRWATGIFDPFRGGRQAPPSPPTGAGRGEKGGGGGRGGGPGGWAGVGGGGGGGGPRSWLNRALGGPGRPPPPGGFAQGPRHKKTRVFLRVSPGRPGGACRGRGETAGGGGPGGAPPPGGGPGARGFFGPGFFGPLPRKKKSKACFFLGGPLDRKPTGPRMHRGGDRSLFNFGPGARGGGAVRGPAGGGAGHPGALFQILGPARGGGWGGGGPIGRGRRFLGGGAGLRLGGGGGAAFDLRGNKRGGGGAGGGGGGGGGRSGGRDWGGQIFFSRALRPGKGWPGGWFFRAGGGAGGSFPPSGLGAGGPVEKGLGGPWGGGGGQRLKVPAGAWGFFSYSRKNRPVGGGAPAHFGGPPGGRPARGAHRGPLDFRGARGPRFNFPGRPGAIKGGDRDFSPPVFPPLPARGGGPCFGHGTKNFLGKTPGRHWRLFPFTGGGGPVGKAGGGAPGGKNRHFSHA